ncbi:lysozyme inhibitor LprI family protein [Stutzerimonas degradans]|uniref:lysozyme inhibitor LprI family protein n=1 Tax=Stutzerimonas degradans TaxID=2968968 RepID=UPI002113FEC6|nr:lysozyme inhibitor LprI family protein [Stutzerimonas degradans]
MPRPGHCIRPPASTGRRSAKAAKCCSLRCKSDKLLNLSYKSTLQRIRHQYQNAPLLADQYITLLKTAQRQWIKLRDADCKLEAFEVEETAEAYQTTINNCASRMSEDRTAYLNKIAPDI